MSIIHQCLEPMWLMCGLMNFREKVVEFWQTFILIAEIRGVNFRIIFCNGHAGAFIMP